jgi:hypothetical protein
VGGHPIANLNITKCICVFKKKGTFVDGHERDNVVEYRKKFLGQMVSLGFLNSDNAPTDDAKKALPTDIISPSNIIDKTVFLFHEETTFQANEDQPTLWAPKGTKVIRTKSKGSGIMISDFICEQSGYLALTDEYDQAKQCRDPTIRKHAR